MMKNHFVAILGIALFLFAFATNGHTQTAPVYVTFTTGHWNMDYQDGTPEAWLALEKKYYDHVTSKNDMLLASEFLTHYFTADNSEFVRVSVYASWEDIDKSGDIDQELIEEAWPDEDARDAYFDSLGLYYANRHSDEIYISLPNIKFPDSIMEDPYIFYVQVQELAFPSDGSTDSIRSMAKELIESTIHANSYVNGVFNMRHLWGSNNRDLVQVQVLKSLADVESSFGETQKLVESHWPDEAPRDAFFGEYDKYFTGKHRDYIYRNVPALRKH